VLESAGAPYTSLYGSPFPTTPNLRRLAERGVVFDNFYSTATHTIGSALAICGGTWNDPHTTSTIIDFPGFPVASSAVWLKGQGYTTYFLASGGEYAWEQYRSMKEVFAVDGWDLARDRNHPFWRNRTVTKPFRDDDYLDDETFA